MKGRSFIRMAFLVFLSNLVGVVFSFLAAPMLRVLYRHLPLSLYTLFTISWALLGIKASSLLLSAMMTSLWLSVGLYSFFEARGNIKMYRALFISALLSTGLVIALVLAWLRFHGLSLQEWLNELMAPLISQWPAFQQMGSLSDMSIVAVLPGLFYFLVLSNLVFGVVLDLRLALFMGLPFQTYQHHPLWLDFRAPDGFVWGFLVGLLGLLLYRHNPHLGLWGLNLVLVTGAVFFFQGIAILETLLIVIRAGLLMRILVYVLLIGQLFFILTGLGLVDYWVDFRLKFAKWFHHLK